MIAKHFLLTSLLFAFPLSASAAVLQAEETLSISLPIQDDLYAAGGDVRISQNIAGDAVIAGGDVSISSTIQQDLIAAGGDVDIEGVIEDDVRVAGGTVDISAIIADDLFVMAGELDIREDAVINGDVHIAGGDVVIAGKILGNVYIEAGNVRLMADIEGDVHINADVVSLSSTIAGNAKISAKNIKSIENTTIAGNLQYWVHESGFEIPDGVVAGEVLFDEELAKYVPHEDKHKAKGMFMAGMFGYSLLASALIIVLCLLFTKSYFVDAAKKIMKEPGMSIWYGFLYVVVTPFLALAFFLTIIGIPIGLLVVISYLFTFYFIKPMTAIVLAKAIEMKYKKKWSKTKLFFLSVLILIAWKIVAMIPFFGMLASTVLVLAGFGTLAQTEWLKFKKVR